MSKSLLIGQPALPSERRALREAILAHLQVERIVELKTVHLGPHHLFLAIRIAFHEGIETDAVARHQL